ncbi:MAG TPA: tetratricopeptide repeat protein [Candidatus Rifleibacterium sp.]|nr:tetratricopeptide repeat protein [Candidatus Rifleibacterium sp.]HPT44456.1 tetratricopeptide repeat protein [Candidatus Rifleibacterium sp.]
MTDLRRLFMALTVTCGLSMVPAAASASRKATDLMSEALKQRAAGNIGEAISSFQVAADQAGNDTQKNLARFMLGDCQLEAGRYSDAADTFNALREAVKTPEEKAEALFRLMQAQTGLGNRSQAKSLYAQLQRQHSSSPYFELAKSFMTTEGIKDSIEEAPAKPETPVKKVVSRPPAPVSDPKPVAVPVQVADAEPAPTSDVLPDEENQTDPETIAETVKPAAETLKPAAEPVKPASAVARAEPQSTSRQPVRSEKKPVSAQAKTSKPGKQVSSETSALLREVLHVDTAVGAAKDELVGKILSLQDSLKDGPDKAGMDQVLFDLAETTVRFGELLEACKTYDKILTHHPVSPLVEKAYFQAIRLRAVLGVHEAVIGWSKAFLAAFPASEYRSQIRALVEYAQAGGNIDLTEGGRVEVATKKAAPAPGNDDTVTANAALAADSQYVAASRKMKDGRYNLAQVDFNRLAAKYPGAPQIWWDSALVNVQLEDFKKAAQAINKMLELDPGNEDANSLSGYIHYRLENFEEAASAYKQAGEPEGRGVNFFDAKNASERMKKSAGKNSKQKEN